MRLLVTLEPAVKARLDVLTRITRQSEGRVISELLIRFDVAYLESLVGDAELARRRLNGLVYPKMEE